MIFLNGSTIEFYVQSRVRLSNEVFEENSDVFVDTDVTKTPNFQEGADHEVTEEIMVSQAIRDSTRNNSQSEVIVLSDAEV